MLTTKEILTREEVMEILKIGRSTFYKLLQTGQLKGFKEGNRYKVPVESVEKYVEMRMRTYVTCEPLIKFDLPEMVELVRGSQVT